MSSSASASTVSACAAGWRDDDFLLFGAPIACGLYQPAHWALCIVYVAFYAFMVAECVVTLIARTNALKFWTVVHYLVWISSAVFMAAFVVAIPGATVTRQFDSAMLVTALGVHMIMVNFGVSGVGQMLIRTANTLLMSTGALKDASAVSGQHRTMLVMQTVNNWVLCTGNVACLIAIQLVPAPETKDLLVNLMFIFWGVCMFLTASTSTWYVYKILVISRDRARFQSSAGSGGGATTMSARPKAIEQMAHRMRLLFVIIFTLTPTTLLFIFIGAFIRARYWMFHVMLMALSPPIVMAALLLARSKLMAWIYLPVTAALLARFGVNIQGAGSSVNDSSAARPTQSAHHLASMSDAEKRISSLPPAALSFIADDDDAMADFLRNTETLS